MECSGQFITGKVSGTASVKGVVNKAIEYQVPYAQDKTIIPTKDEQTIMPDEGYNTLSKVVVESIPDEYIIPSGDITITKNWEYDVKERASANVNIPEPTGTLEINVNGTYNVKDKEFAQVNVPEPKLGTKSITSNGIYKASDDGLDGYSEVNVETSGVDINDYFLEKYNFASLISWIKKIPVIDITDIENMNSSFANATNLIELPQLDFSNATLMANCFNNCIRLVTIPQINAHKVRNIYYAFYECRSLENFGGMNNLGESYPTTISENNSSQTLDLSYANKLTHDSLINVINNLYDIATAGVKPQQLILGATNLAKLTEEEIKIATDKGWTVS